MTPKESGFLLLTSQLGNPERKVLTAAQLRILAQRALQLPRRDANRDLTLEDLVAMGYDRGTAVRIVSLLEEEALLQHYLTRGRSAGCVPLTRISEGYPRRVRQALGLNCPGSLWAKGNLRLLETMGIALVGSRELHQDNWKFAAQVGRQAALQGYTLISGNARGADKTAQAACLDLGGNVISVVADELEQHPVDPHILYLSEDGFDRPFSSLRALSRNRIIHSLGLKTLVAQCSFQTGGTWDGTIKNLRFGWSPVFCFRDGSKAVDLLEQMGATGITLSELENLANLRPNIESFFDQ